MSEEDDRVTKKLRLDDGSSAQEGLNRWGSSTPRVVIDDSSEMTPRRDYSDSTPLFSQTPLHGVDGMSFGMTPGANYEGMTPKQSHFENEKGDAFLARVNKKVRELEQESERKNKPFREGFLDEFLPSSEFYTRLERPLSYQPPPEPQTNFRELAIQIVELEKENGLGDLPVGEMEDDAVPVTYDIPDSLGPGMPEMTAKDAPFFLELLQYTGQEDKIPATSIRSYMLMKNLFKVKNGDASQRRAGTRYLLEKASVLGPSLIFQRLFNIWQSPSLDPQQRHYLVEFTKALITKLGPATREVCKEVVHMMEPLLSSQERFIREDGRQTLVLLTRMVGFHAVWNTIEPDFKHENAAMRRHTAKVVALMTSAVGLDDALVALDNAAFNRSPLARQTAARSLGEICTTMGHAVVSHLTDIARILDRLLQDDRRVSTEAALGVALMAEASAPFGQDELLKPSDRVFGELRKGNKSPEFLRAFGSLLPLMTPEEARSRIGSLMPVLVDQFSSPEEKYRLMLLTVIRQSVDTEGITVSFIEETLLKPFFEGFWKITAIQNGKKTLATLVAATVAMAKKIGSQSVLSKLAEDALKSDDENFQQLALYAVRRVISAVGLGSTPTKLTHHLLDRAITAIKRDLEGKNKGAIDTLVAICNALGPDLKPMLGVLYSVIKERREHSSSILRIQGAQLISRLAHTLKKAGGGIFLAEVSINLFTRMKNESSFDLSANLQATRVLLEVLGEKDYRPSLPELLGQLTYVIKNPLSAVQQNAVALIEDIVTNYDDEVKEIHLHKLATKGLFELLDADRRETRRICARTFGTIAAKLSPFAIILELVDNFRQDKRKIRICTAVALGAIAKSCGPFTVLPYILNEFEASEGEQVAVIVQHSVLKAVRYIFEAIGTRGEDYIYPCIPLLQRALTEASIPMRRMAMEAARAMLLSGAGLDGFEKIAMHLLNLIHPNIVELLSKKEVKIGEERLKLVSAVVSFYEAAQMHLGSGVIYAYLSQGLFHPAKLVRDIFRRAYNIIYILSPEEMVPHHPQIPDGFECSTASFTENGQFKEQPQSALKRFCRYEIQVPF